MMQIVQQTQTRLTIRFLPVFLWVCCGFAEAIGLWGLPRVFVMEPSMDKHMTIYFVIAHMTIAFVFLVVGGKIITCSFDQTLDRVTLTYKSLLGTKVIQYPIKEIAEVRLRATSATSHGYQIVLVLRSGMTAPLSTYGRGGIGVKESLEKIIECILTFLNSQTNSSKKASEKPQRQEREIGSTQWRLEREIAKWQAVIKINPTDAEAHYRLGAALYRQGHPQEASANLKLAMELFSDQGNSNKAAQIQSVMWEFGLEE